MELLEAKMTKSKKFINILTLFILIPMLLLAFFVSVSKDEIKHVSAYSENDTSNGFVDTLPVLYSSLCRYNADGPITLANEWYTIQFSFSYSKTVNTNGSSKHSLTINGVNSSNTEQSCCSLLSSNSNQNAGSLAYVPLSFSTNATTTYNVTNLNVGENSRYLTNSLFKEYYAGSYMVFDFNIYITNNFDYTNLYLMTVRSFYSESSCYGYNDFTYYSSDSEYLRFRFYSYFPSVESKYFNERFYLASHDYYYMSNLTDDQYYNDGYNSGYSDGYNNGYYYGDLEGYESGYKSGEIVGYNNGYSEGVEDSGNYSFLSLIGAVIDAPVSAFTSLLNFELLGVNILGFISGLLTLALIIFIIKLCMGGK